MASVNDEESLELCQKLQDIYPRSEAPLNFALKHSTGMPGMSPLLYLLSEHPVVDG